MKPILAILLATLFTFSGCKKEDYENAPFRCKINGKEFTASGEFATVSVTGGNNFYVRGTRISNPLNDDLYGEIKLDFIANGLDTIELNLANTWRWSNNGGDSYRASGSDPGQLIITSLDMNEKRITGKYELTAYADNSNETKSVTEGFFDVSW